MIINHQTLSTASNSLAVTILRLIRPADAYPLARQRHSVSSVLSQVAPAFSNAFRALYSYLIGCLLDSRLTEATQNQIRKTLSILLIN